MAECEVYDDNSDVSGIEDGPTERESELSADEADDQGFEREEEDVDESLYVNIPDYVAVEDVPLCLRAFERAGPTQELRSVLDRMGPHTQRSASDEQGLSEDLSDQAIAGHSRDIDFAVAGSSRDPDPQFEDAFESSPSKRARLSLRNLPERSYIEAAEDDPSLTPVSGR